MCYICIEWEKNTDFQRKYRTALLALISSQFLFFISWCVSLASLPRSMPFLPLSCTLFIGLSKHNDNLSENWLSFSTVWYNSISVAYSLCVCVPFDWNEIVEANSIYECGLICVCNAPFFISLIFINMLLLSMEYKSYSFSS